MLQYSTSIIPHCIILRVGGQQFRDLLQRFWCILMFSNLSKSISNSLSAMNMKHPPFHELICPTLGIFRSFGVPVDGLHTTAPLGIYSGELHAVRTLISTGMRRA